MFPMSQEVASIIFIFNATGTSKKGLLQFIIYTTRPKKEPSLIIQ